MKIPSVSVIVPIYNVEKYLPQCVESIQNQTLKDIEIILVDDGSPDNSGKMADEYAKQDNRIKVVHQKNKWLGGARNAGLKIAQGEYLCCVDADDYIAPEYCEKLYSFAKANHCEIVLFDSLYFKSDGLPIVIFAWNSYFESGTVLQKEQIQNHIYKQLIRTYDFNLPHPFFNKSIIKKGFLFDEDIRYAEDYEAALRVYKIAESVGFLNEPLYYYRQNEESIMHVVKFERLNQIIHLFVLREAFIKENNLETPENLYNSAHLLIKLLIEKFPFVFGTKDKKYSLKKAEIKELLSDKNLQTALGRISLKNLQMGLFGKICLIGLKLRLPVLIILSSKKYRKKTI